MTQESPVNSPSLTAEPAHVTHFAKTLRLSSDQLVSLSLSSSVVWLVISL